MFTREEWLHPVTLDHKSQPACKVEVNAFRRSMWLQCRMEFAFCKNCSSVWHLNSVRLALGPSRGLGVRITVRRSQAEGALGSCCISLGQVEAKDSARQITGQPDGAEGTSVPLLEPERAELLAGPAGCFVSSRVGEAMRDAALSSNSALTQKAGQSSGPGGRSCWIS